MKLTPKQFLEKYSDLKLSDIARETGLSQTTVSDALSGKHAVSKKTFEAFKNAFNVELIVQGINDFIDYNTNADELTRTVSLDNASIDEQIAILTKRRDLNNFAVRFKQATKNIEMIFENPILHQRAIEFCEFMENAFSKKQDSANVKKIVPKKRMTKVAENEELPQIEKPRMDEKQIKEEPKPQSQAPKVSEPKVSEQPKKIFKDDIDEYVKHDDLPDELPDLEIDQEIDSFIPDDEPNPCDDFDDFDMSMDAFIEDDEF